MIDSKPTAYDFAALENALRETGVEFKHGHSLEEKEDHGHSLEDHGHSLEDHGHSLEKRSMDADIDEMVMEFKHGHSLEDHGHSLEERSADADIDEIQNFIDEVSPAVKTKIIRLS